MMENKEPKKDSLFIKAIPYFDKYGILLLLLIMIIGLHLLQPEVFLSWRNVTNVFKQIIILPCKTSDLNKDHEFTS